MRMKKKKLEGHKEMWLYFTGIIFATIFAVFIIVSILWSLLAYMGFVTISSEDRKFPILFFLLGSILLGFVVTICVGKMIIRPLQRFGKAFDEIAKGNFEYRLSMNARFDDINKMAERLNEMAYDLGHIETLRNDFVTNVSHEFKTPLAAIEGYATLLQNHTLAQERKDYYIDKILENTTRLSGLSSNVLTLSRLENQGDITECQEFRLDEQIRKTVIMLEEKWSAKNIEFDMELPKLMYYGSETLLAQVWLNIIDNAIKCSYENGVINIGIEVSDNYIVVSIRDHGIGMSSEVKKHVFEKFYQGDRSRKAEGNGLGLALVKRILELCHGTVEVESEEGDGSVFSVTLYRMVQPLD